jgi:colanic acid/amylovoran biosynthesis glycosyltransferase
MEFQLQVARKYKARILHSHWGDVGWRDLIAARSGKMAHVVTFYGKDVNYYPQSSVWRKRYHQLFKQVNLVLCEGPHMANCIVRLGCPTTKVRVQHLGVDIDNIAFEPRAWRSGPLRVLIAGSFREKKGIPYALEALGLLLKELPDLEITIVGDESKDPRSHPEKIKILDTLKKYQMQSKTRMLGYQSYAVLLAEAYKHHVFMSPSVTAMDGDTEGGAPVTIIEMAASGMPIISTTHCDIPSVVIHGKTGLLAAERDVNGLVQHLRWYVTHPEHWQEMVMAGRLHVEAEYDVIKQADRLSDIYKSLGFNS